MNRQGQPPQRPPTMAPNPSLASQYRQPYPYTMPPRNVLQPGAYVPSLQPSNHRQTNQQPSIPPQTSAFLQQRGQSSFGFPTNPLQQQQSTNGTSSSLLPHLTQTPNLSNAASASVSSASEVGLDPNDFPALGSISSNNNNSGSTASGNVTTSYATQAGTGVTLGSNGGGTSMGGVGSLPRDFTADDFPALGGQVASPNQNHDGHSHPPGINGFQHSDNSRSLLGTLTAGMQPQSTPGMLNLAPTQTRSMLQSFQQQGHGDSEKQQRNNYALKSAVNAAWNSPNLSSQQPAGLFSTQSVTQQNGAPNNSTSLLSAPPGVPNPNTSFSQQQTIGQYPSNGLDSQPTNPILNPNAGNSTQNPSLPSSTSQGQQHPQTPAQQVLMSAADRWGLLGLVAMIKSTSTDPDQGLSGVGTDLGTMGLDMGYPGNLFSTFITPWADQSAAHRVEPDFSLPACYAITTPAPGPAKAAAFSDETLFFMFYSSPRDALQEVAAQELHNRNWRFHKELRLWITKENTSSPSQKINGGESGQYTYWDPENWIRERKEMAVLYQDLEDKSVPAFAQAATLIPAQPQQPQQQIQQTQALPTQRTSFPIGV